jgi:Ca2+-binding RTX toxin-like protein
VGPDTLTGNAGSDTLFGGSDASQDTLVEATTAASVFLTTANLVAGITDFLNGLEVASLTGGAANQTLDASGFNGRVMLDGAGGNDSLIGTLNDDTLFGGSGNDTLSGRSGSDQLDAGDGSLDRLVETSDANQVLSNGTLVITQGVTLLSTDVLTSFEQASLTGGLGPNVIAASQFTGTVTLTGSSGHDYLVGTNNADSLLGGSGNDSLTGGGGNDTLLAGASDIDRLIEAGDVSFTLDPLQLAGLGTDTLDSFEEAHLEGGPSANSLNTTAFAGPVTLAGNGGNDSLTSSAGADNLSGGPGDDTLSGGGGADVLAGDADTDLLKESGDVNFVLTDTNLTGLGALSAVGFEQASLTGGAGNNTFDLTAWNHPATVQGAAGLDSLLLGGTAGADAYAISGSAVTYGAVTMQFGDIEGLSVAGGDGDDVFQALSLPLAEGGGLSLTSLTLIGGNGDDVFDLAPFPSVPVAVDGGDHLAGDRLDYHAGGLYVDQTPGRLLADGQQPLTHANVESLTLFNRLYRIFLAFLQR